METRANYVMIGAFVLLAAAALMLFTVWIGGSRFNRENKTFDIVFQGAVNGLSEGGEVRFNGIKVGEVRQLSLDAKDPTRVIARIRVDERTPVRADSVATLEFLGITGVTFIQLSGGTPGGPLLTQPLGAPPPVLQAERTVIDELFAGGQDLLSVGGETLQNLNRVLDEKNTAALGDILANLAVASRKLSEEGGVLDSTNSALKSIDRAAATVDRAAASLDGAAKSIDRATVSLSGEAGAALTEAGPLLKEARAALARLQSSLDQVDRQVAPAASRALEQLSATARDLGALMIRIDGLAAEVEQDPSRFVFRQPQPVER